VLLIEDGRVAADGTYGELMRNHPMFQRFAEAGVSGLNLQEGTG